MSDVFCYRWSVISVVVFFFCFKCKKLLDMNILVLTSIYPADDLPKTFTPVVHYFVREWIRSGHNVKVVNLCSDFPRLYYTLARVVGIDRIASIVGHTIMPKKISEKRYLWDGVDVLRLPMQKYFPHGRCSNSVISDRSQQIYRFCDKESFVPDLIVGHWVNPQLDIILSLKEYYPRAITALTLHDSVRCVEKLYGDTFTEKISKLNKVGFRNEGTRRLFLERFHIEEEKTYVCYSGIPDSFFNDSNERFVHKFSATRTNFLFVGTLFARKYPEAIIKSALMAKLKDFSISYVGRGEMEKKIDLLVGRNSLQNKVKMLGRLPREDVKTEMLNSDVFVMISKDEVYGLVYLEAMSAGCIVVASKNEGFDGIIKDGYNGFLCTAGDWLELSGIMNRIQALSEEELQHISANAIETASSMKDSLCAERYLSTLLSR